MPRSPRLHVEGGFYHVMLRGNHREALFGEDADRLHLNDIVADALVRFDSRLHAFCWMSNHLHALIEICERPLGHIMQCIAMRYSRYRHKRMATTGHLFEKRYVAKLVEVDEYFLSVLRYIHLNPVAAKMVDDAGQFRWSSHLAYLGTRKMPWVTTEFGLAMFHSRLRPARRAYLAFMQDRPAAPYSFDTGHPDDRRVLGCDEFLAALPEVDYSPRNTLSLDELATTICQEAGHSLDEVRSSSRRRQLTPVRLTIARRALDEGISSLTVIARYLGRDPSSLCKLLARHV